LRNRPVSVRTRTKSASVTRSGEWIHLVRGGIEASVRLRTNWYWTGTYPPVVLPRCDAKVLSRRA